MGFIDAYKRLEKLCGEVLDDDRKVSAYIDEMLNTPRGAYYVSGWDKDLKQLKHYRWIRNRIVHDPGCSEENMCSDDDIQWLVDFYSRIMDRTDPLALYRKAMQPQQKRIKKSVDSHYYRRRHHRYYHRSDGQVGCLVLLLLIVIIVFVAVALRAVQFNWL